MDLLLQAQAAVLAVLDPIGVVGAPAGGWRKALRHSTIEHIPVTKYVTVRKVPEHYERVYAGGAGGKRWARRGGYGGKHVAPYRIPAPGWGTYHADWIEDGKDRRLCLQEQIHVTTSEYKRSDTTAAERGKENWRGTVRSILGEPWTNWNEATDRMEQCWHSGTGERVIDSHVRCRVAARPCWSIDKQVIDKRPEGE